MAEIDTSSYPKPVQSNFLDTAAKFQGLAQGGVNLERSNIALGQDKVKQVNDQFQLMNAELATLANDPKVTKEQAASRLTTLAKTFGFKPEVTQHMLNELQTAPDVPTFAKTAILRGQDTISKFNSIYGTVQYPSNGQQVQPVAASPMTGVRPIAAPFQVQPPPTTETVDTSPTLPNGQPNPNYGSRRLIGPQPSTAPAGVSPLPGGLPVADPDAPRPVKTQRILPVGKGNLINDGQVTGVDVQDVPTPNQKVSNRFPGGPPTALPPGVAEAATNAGAAAGQQLASERTKAASFQRDIFPLAQAIPALEKLGTKGTGPGTETVNNIKSFVLSNIPGVKETDFGFGTVKDFDKAKKYLTDFVNQNGNSGTNDKLAAAFAGNPSVGISNAAAVDVAKSALALRRMQQSKYLAYEDSGLPADQASKFFANGQIKLDDGRTLSVGQLDPRAFGIDNMTDKAKKVLLDELNKNPREKDLFDKSLEIAKKHGYLAVR